MPFKIAPHYIPSNNSFFFSADELNSFQRAQYADTFGFWQNRFGLYSYMRLNSLRKYVVHSPKGHPLMWQPYKACSASPTGSLTIGQREITPTPIEIFEKFCHDTLIDSAFQQLIRWDANGTEDMDAEMTRIFQQLLDELMANAAYGFRLSLTSGQLYNVDTVNYSADNPANITDLFKRTHGSVRGWVKLVTDLAQEAYPHLDLALTTDGDFNANGDFTGDIVDLIDALKSNATKKFKNLINRGGVMRGNGMAFRPLVVLSDSFYNAVVDYFNAQAVTPATNSVRVVQREVGGQNGNTPTIVYYLDNRLPIIPLSDISGFDEYLAGDTHFAGIVASGNVQLGTSFDAIPGDIEANNMGFLIARNTDPTSQDFGMYAVRSTALGASAIADPDYMVSTVNYTEPAG